MEDVTIWTYGEYASGNYGVNAMAVTVGSLTIYFSYRTPVAFSHPSTGLVVRKNGFSVTTGKHLNWIDGGNKKDRVDGSEFEDALSSLVDEQGINPIRG